MATQSEQAQRMVGRMIAVVAAEGSRMAPDLRRLLTQERMALQAGLQRVMAARKYRLASEDPRVRADLRPELAALEALRAPMASAQATCASWGVDL